ncbi:hypothetical protein GALMADRAFT_159439 [Galerina marginata CBS 339.88]|uniref:Extracellular membrane protein CFEM domain-containing protein n=1 Tax=Galerina marginata (strain CBS 339.88) TaxID=685588 RepID=A0A067SL03_GALM3|nr:hypothetical protein GALMADRAFT_159439 [Galerina marginata CBS 339.88]
MYKNQCTTLLLASIVFASQVAAIVPRSPFAHILVPRQSSCDSACATFSNALDACTTKGCLCVPSVASGLQSCVNCATSGNPTADIIATAQQLVDTFQSTCSGFGLAPVTVQKPQTPQTPVNTPNPVTPPVAPPGTTPVVVTPPPVTVTRTAPANTPTAPAVVPPTTTLPAGTTFVNGPSVSQVVVGPQSTVSADPNAIPGLTSAASRGVQVVYGGVMVLAMILGTVLAL